MARSKGRPFAKGSKHLVTHGMARTKIYRIWLGMRRRCDLPTLPAYPNYGGRGISVCDRWQIFANFYADMGECPDGMSLDRIDNDRDYEPGNCRWATRLEQARNKRGLHILAYGGAERPLCEWAEISGIKLQTLWARLKNGWEPERALSAPVRQSGRWPQHAYAAEHGVQLKED